ncbi:hypothetical protein RKE29_29170 [Streptomyces sp. B1866]|uniref:hypothetical protein n=1 Tax=Streptomyces sp. B1866 TaxID=3075431 RepID=UPI00288DD9C3|nr:hypothetical protein [Streptomyces sp. B1866]MDT3400626.1 hypothetical protein [Streptomyces sp. B1866]
MFRIASTFPVEPTGEPLGFFPRYSISGLFVSVSPPTDQESHEKLLSETFGSTDWLWSGDDELRFDRRTGNLVGFTFKTPEEAPDHSWDPRPWLLAPASTGALRACSKENFDARPAETRWVSDDGSHLVCAHRGSLKESARIERLNVARDLDFVFEDGNLSGWILRNPANHLVQQWDLPRKNSAPPGLGESLRDYLSIIVQPNIESMQEEDPRILERLTTLRQKLINIPGDIRRDIIIAQIDRLCDDWYGTAG